MDAVRSQEAIRDAFAQAVRVDRIAEVPVCVPVVRTQRRRGHAKLNGGLKVLEDLAPVALLASAAAVTLVDNDEVEEVAWKLAIQAGTHFIVRDRLVRREVHLAALASIAAADLVTGVSEGSERFVLGVVDEHVAVSQVEDARLAEFARAVPAR